MPNTNGTTHKKSSDVLCRKLMNFLTLAFRQMLCKFIRIPIAGYRGTKPKPDIFITIRNPLSQDFLKLLKRIPRQEVDKPRTIYRSTSASILINTPLRHPVF